MANDKAAHVINGPLGVGKTAVYQRLYKQLDSSVWLALGKVAGWF